MTTTFRFEAPSDLSIGRIRIKDGKGTIADWIATPDNPTYVGPDVMPGLYSAEIGPTGLPAQFVMFEVCEDMVNEIVLPDFSSLSATGSNTTFYDTLTGTTVNEVPESDLALLSARAARVKGSTSAQERLTVLLEGKPIRPLSSPDKMMSIGLSREKHGRETFGPFAGECLFHLSGGKLNLELPAPTTVERWSGHRVRMTAAIEKLRIERCLLPLYRGGTKITVTPPTFSPVDLEMNIYPSDPRLRALVRAIDVGTLEEANAVREGILISSDLAALDDLDAGDPWVLSSAVS